MAIQYLRISFQKLLPRRGAQWLFAYLRRADVLDRHARRWVHFSGIQRDLVYEDVLLHGEAAPGMDDPVELARAIDHAEGRLLRKRRNRKRWPQVGATFVAALPPDSQVSYDEAIELTYRLANRIRDGLPIPVYLAIHDPARDPSRRFSPNRHAHLVAPLRGMDRFGFLRTKLRNVFARPRTSEQNADATYIAEGVNWPRVHRELQTLFFLERGLDLVVDPPLPVGNRHWSATVWREDPERVEADREVVRHKNRELLFGEPAVLVDRLLRGRSIMPITELGRFLALLIDNKGERTNRLEQILTTPGVVTFAIHPEDRRPSRISTSAIQEFMQKAVDIIHARRRNVDDSRIVVMSGVDREAVTADLARQIGLQPERAVFLIGEVESDCAALKERLEGRSSQISTIEYQLGESFNPYRSDGLRIEFEKDDLVVLPRSEKTDDLAVAKLIVTCAERGAYLLVGYDQSRQEGIVSNRLAAFMAESLGAPATSPMDLRDAERHLKCGWPALAIELLTRAGVLEFEPTHDGKADNFNFLVSDDRHRIVMANQNSNPGEGTLEHGPDWLSSSDWITFTKTDYGDDLPSDRRPIFPTIRENRLAQFVDILPGDRRILISHTTSGLEEIDLKRFPHLRRVSAISIRQAYYAPANTRLKIELTKSRYAWASLLLAVRRATNSKLRVDPSVARDGSELLSAVRRSLPSALSSELGALTDPEAELTRILEEPTVPVPSDAGGAEIEIEKFPVPGSAAHSDRSGYFVPETRGRNAAWAEPIEAQIPRGALHEQIWEILASTPGGQDIVNDFEQWAEAQTRDEIYERLIRLYRGRPMEDVVRAFMPPREKAPPEDRPEEEEIDEPLDLVNGRPREWSANELEQFRQDIRTFRWQFDGWSVDLAQMPDIEEPDEPDGPV